MFVTADYMQGLVRNKKSLQEIQAHYKPVVQGKHAATIQTSFLRAKTAFLFQYISVLHT